MQGDYNLWAKGVRYKNINLFIYSQLSLLLTSISQENLADKSGPELLNRQIAKVKG